MDRAALAEALIASARQLERPPSSAARATEAEGGCGVVGVAASVAIPGRALLQPLARMRNRGNGKGGGIAAVGLDPRFLDVPAHLLHDDYLVAVAYLDPTARPEVERSAIEPTFVVDRVVELRPRPEVVAARGLEVPPPDVAAYLGRVRPDVVERFAAEHGIATEDREAAEDEIVFQNTFRLNRDFYAAAGVQRAFVLSHGHDQLVLKLVGHGDDVIAAYGLDDLRAHVWIGHHRYPTKGRVWHPGGAHPFVGLHEALVHNGDFANYASICASLAQRGRYPQFLTDTEVAVLVFDLLHRTYGYSLEHVIEALAPTTERDFALLPADRRRIYRQLQAAHMHASPDGPWYFLIAQAARREREYRLIGITDTSMLRPQVFALQHGAVKVGAAASEKQALDALFESLAHEDRRVWSRADRYWSARGGSHTDGGAFIFRVRPGDAERHGSASGAPCDLVCTDKFGRVIEPEPARRAPGEAAVTGEAAAPGGRRREPGDPAAILGRDRDAGAIVAACGQQLSDGGYDWLRGILDALLASAASDADRDRALAVATSLIDGPCAIGDLKRSAVQALVDDFMAAFADSVRQRPSPRYGWADAVATAESRSGRDTTGPFDGRRWSPDATIVVDARDLPAEGPRSLARLVVALVGGGARNLLVTGMHGQRFVGSGLGPGSEGVRLDVFGSSGDYLASGIDGAEVVVHATAQDQVAQILKAGTLVIHGDVGQTFMYGAKGGDVFVRGSAAGRPLINAVGRPRVVINGTCLDYLAESCMAGDPLSGGGFVILNGVAFDEAGELRELPTPYPGGNLFSLASGGAIYVRDPRGLLGEDQLNGGEFTTLSDADWTLLEPYLERNARLFDIPVAWLLTVDGRARPPAQVYRKIRPAKNGALSPEEAWIRREA